MIVEGFGEGIKYVVHYITIALNVVFCSRLLMRCESLVNMKSHLLRAHFGRFCGTHRLLLPEPVRDPVGSSEQRLT